MSLKDLFLPLQGPWISFILWYHLPASLHNRASPYGSEKNLNQEPSELHPSEMSMSQLPREGAHRHHKTAIPDLDPLLRTPYSSVYFGTTFFIKQSDVDYIP